MMLIIPQSNSGYPLKITCSLPKSTFDQFTPFIIPIVSWKIYVNFSQYYSNDQYHHQQNSMVIISKTTKKTCFFQVSTPFDIKTFSIRNIQYLSNIINFLMLTTRVFCILVYNFPTTLSNTAKMFKIFSIYKHLTKRKEILFCYMIFLEFSLF